MYCKLTAAEQEAFDRLYTILGRTPTLDEIRVLVAQAEAEPEAG